MGLLDELVAATRRAGLLDVQMPGLDDEDLPPDVQSRHSESAPDGRWVGIRPRLGYTDENYPVPPGAESQPDIYSYPQPIPLPPPDARAGNLALDESQTLQAGIDAWKAAQADARRHDPMARYFEAPKTLADVGLQAPTSQEIMQQIWRRFLPQRMR